MSLNIRLFTGRKKWAHVAYMRDVNAQACADALGHGSARAQAGLCAAGLGAARRGGTVGN